MSDSDHEADGEGGLDLFKEPEDFYPPSPPPSFVTHVLPRSGHEIKLRLVGHNPLWGHYLWNGGRVVSDYLDDKSERVRGRTVLELGAGAGLPSLASAVLGAAKVVVTDYPDIDLVQNLQLNIDACENVPPMEDGSNRIVAEGYLWGATPEPLLKHLPADGQAGFDILILADLLFNHSEHLKLVQSVEQCLKRNTDAQALVFFTPYRPWLLDQDLAFFNLVQEHGFSVEKILEQKMDKVMFENDRGDEEVRRTVHGYILRWKLENCSRA